MHPSSRSLFAAAFGLALVGGAGAGLMWASLRIGALTGALMAACVAAYAIASERRARRESAAASVTEVALLRRQALMAEDRGQPAPERAELTFFALDRRLCARRHRDAPSAGFTPEMVDTR